MIALPVLSPYSPEAMPGITALGGSTLTATVSSVWPTANQLIGYPLRIFSPTLITKLWMYNGATASGNLDVGIYDEKGNKIVSSGSTAQATTNQLQVLDITDTQLGIGDFYLCAAMNGTTGTAFKCVWVHGAHSRMLGQVEVATAFPLPATVTFGSATNNLPIFGALVWPRTVI